jgi:hypothetical protein
VPCLPGLFRLLYPKSDHDGGAGILPILFRLKKNPAEAGLLGYLAVCPVVVGLTG